MRNPLREHLPIRLLLLGALSACGSSTVPSLSADSLNQPAMRQLAPRELDIRVEDLRPVSEEDRTATERHVKEVLQLTWLLRRPAPAALGSEPIDVCRQLDVTRSRDSRSSNGSWWTCGSPSANDALVSDILVALDRNGL